MFPSDETSTLRNPFGDYSSLEENPNTFLNFSQHFMLEDDELTLGDFLYHHHQQQSPPPARGGGDQRTTEPLPDEAPEVISTKICKKAAIASSSKNRNCKRKDKDKSDQGTPMVNQKPLDATATGKKKRTSSSRQQRAAGPPKRRTGNTDRHSKINTAQGPRDRRMRLSLQIARKFFDLQDMLGFDKASKTIEWLFTKSKAAIKELVISSLSHQRRSLSCRSAASSAADTTTTTSECVGMEIIDEISHGNNGVHSSSNTKIALEVDPAAANATRKNKRRSSHHKKQQQEEAHSHLSLVRESRDKARARARERTREKMIQKEIEKSKQHILGDHHHHHYHSQLQQTNPSNVDAENNFSRNNTNNSTISNYHLYRFMRSFSNTPVTTGDESAHDFTSSIEISPSPAPRILPVDQASDKCSTSSNFLHQSLEQRMASIGIIEDLLGSSSPSLSAMYGYHHHHFHHDHQLQVGEESVDHDQFMGFPGDWMVESARISGEDITAAGYAAATMNIIGESMTGAPDQDQNPNSFFMPSSGGIYFQPQHQFLQNQFSYSSNSLDPYGNRISL